MKFNFDKWTKYLLVLSVIIVTSFFISESSLFGLMYFFFFIAILITVLLGVVVFDLIRKKNNSKVLLILLSVFITAGFIGITIRSIKQSNNEAKAKALVIELETYIEEQDSLPETIIEIDSKNTFDGLRYTKKGHHFSLWYSVDGWHSCTYTSEDKEWYCGD
ncbi:MAG: hypothetical protein ACPGTP_00975 [Bacteroidia bacterium]